MRLFVKSALERFLWWEETRWIHLLHSKLPSSYDMKLLSLPAQQLHAGASQVEEKTPDSFWWCPSPPAATEGPHNPSKHDVSLKIQELLPFFIPSWFSWHGLCIHLANRGLCVQPDLHLLSNIMRRKSKTSPVVGLLGHIVFTAFTTFPGSPHISTFHHLSVWSFFVILAVWSTPTCISFSMTEWYTVVANIIRTLGIFKRFWLFLLNWPLKYPQ